MTTSAKEEVKNPKVHEQKMKPVLGMINKYNIAELSLVDRPVAGTKAGVGAVISRHADNHDARYWRTENRDNFGINAAKGPSETVAEFENA